MTGTSPVGLLIQCLCLMQVWVQDGVYGAAERWWSCNVIRWGSSDGRSVPSCDWSDRSGCHGWSAPSWRTFLQFIHTGTWQNYGSSFQKKNLAILSLYLFVLFFSQFWVTYHNLDFFLANVSSYLTICLVFFSEICFKICVIFIFIRNIPKHINYIMKYLDSHLYRLC